MIPQSKGIYILLDHHPRVHVDWFCSTKLNWQILGINVVKKLSRMCKVKDVKVVQILIYQLAKWRLTCKIEVKFVKLGCSGYKSRVKICPYLGLTQPTTPQIWKKDKFFLGLFSSFGANIFWSFLTLATCWSHQLPPPIIANNHWCTPLPPPTDAGAWWLWWLIAVDVSSQWLALMGVGGSSGGGLW